MDIIFIREEVNSLFTTSKLKINEERSNTIMFEHTPSLLPCGIYKVALVETDRDRRRQVAIVACDAETRGKRHPHILATFQGGNSCLNAKPVGMGKKFSDLVFGGDCVDVKGAGRTAVESKGAGRTAVESKGAGRAAVESKDDYHVNVRLLHQMGICFRSAEVFDRFFERVEKCIKRGEEISLFIDDTFIKKTKVPHYWLEDSYHGCKADVK